MALKDSLRRKKVKKKIRRPGVHAKTKQSDSKTADLYKKRNVGQGR